ncbi:hypothetical protein D3C87_1834570 [compost metagenome]
MLFTLKAFPGPLASARTATSLRDPMAPLLLNTCVAPPNVTPLLSAQPPCSAALLLTLTVPPRACASIADEFVPRLVIAPVLLTETLAAPEASARIP